MTSVTSAEISQARAVLENNANANAALQIIEECGGNLEDAVEILMIESGTMGEVNRRGLGTSLSQLAQKCRHVICQEEFQEEIVDEFSRDLLNTLIPIVTAQLTIMGNLPAALSIPIVMYVLKLGIKRYCGSTNSES